MKEILFSQLAKLRCKASIVSVRHLSDLEQEIRDYHRKGSFDEKFYEERLSRFVFSVSSELSYRCHHASSLSSPGRALYYFS